MNRAEREAAILRCLRNGPPTNYAWSLGEAVTQVPASRVARLARAGLVAVGELHIGGVGHVCVAVVAIANRAAAALSGPQATLLDPDDAALLWGLLREEIQIRGHKHGGLADRWWHRRWWAGAFIDPMQWGEADRLVATGQLAVISTVEGGRITAMGFGLASENDMEAW
jgi:hypothetical protein